MKDTVIVDIDGTVAKVGDRIKFLNQTPKDWDAFYEACDEDEPIEEMIYLVNTLQKDYSIVFCSGRRESCREKTNIWIANNFDIEDGWDFLLLLRPNKDHRHDTEVKPEMLAKAGIKLEQIAFVLEDRNTMVKKWRELGLICLQVAEGDF